MSMTYVVSWPYDDTVESERKARDLFDKIRESIGGPDPRLRFPYDAQCEVALVNGTDGWILAVAGAPQDPALAGTLERWIKACGAEQPSAAEIYDIRDEELEDVVRRRGWGKLVNFTGALAH